MRQIKKIKNNIIIDWKKTVESLELELSEIKDKPIYDFELIIDSLILLGVINVVVIILGVLK